MWSPNTECLKVKNSIVFIYTCIFKYTRCCPHWRNKRKIAWKIMMVSSRIKKHIEVLEIKRDIISKELSEVKLEWSKARHEEQAINYHNHHHKFHRDCKKNRTRAKRCNFCAVVNGNNTKGHFVAAGIYYNHSRDILSQRNKVYILTKNCIHGAIWKSITFSRQAGYCVW